MADQAGPSSRPVPRSQQFVTFVFDPSLSRSRYTELLQPQGAVQSVIKRALEKHQGDSNLRLDAVVSPTLPHRIDKRARGRNSQTGFLSTPSFLARLPALASSFSEQSGCDAGETVRWSSFGRSDSGSRGGRKRKRREEVGLMEGVIRAVEELREASKVVGEGSIPKTLVPLCPPEAQPILTALYTPPPTPPQSTAFSSTDTTRYLIIFANGSSPSPVKGYGDSAGSDVKDEWKPMVRDCCWGPESGEIGWDEMGQKCGDLGVKVSLVLFGSSSSPDQTSTERLKAFVQKLSTDTPNPAWFTLPPDSFTHLVSLSLPSSTVIQPPILAPAATIGRSSPSTNPAPSSTTDDPSSASSQIMAMRLLAQRANAPGGISGLPGGLSNPAVAAALQNFMTAARNGNVDPNDPQMAHFRQMIMMQQQAQHAQQVQAQVQVGDQGQGQVKMAEQLTAAAGVQRQKAMQAMQAMQAAQLQQQQRQQQQQPQQSQPNQQQQQRQPPQQQQQSAQSSGQGAGATGGQKARVWCGEIVWPTQGLNGGVTRLSVECTAVNNGNLTDPSQLANILPAELRIVSSMQADVNFLQQFVREKKVPVIQFGLNADAPIEPTHNKRFESLINGLSSKGTAGVVAFNGSDRGMMLCTAPGGTGQPPRLLGVLCLNIPLPTSFSRQQAPSDRPTPTLASVQGSSNFPSQPKQPQSQSQNQGQNQVQGLAGPIDLPAPYNPSSQQQQSYSQAGLNNNTGPVMAQINPIQFRQLIEQAAKVGIDKPQGLDPSQITQEQLKGLIQSVRQKNLQQRQQLMLQQQQQLQGAGGNAGMDPRLMAGAGVDPRLMSGPDSGGNQLGLQQMQAQLQNNIGRGGDGGDGYVQGKGQGYGGQYQGGQ